MFKRDSSGKKSYIVPMDKEKVEEILKRYNINLENKIGYDHIYVANMCKADFLGSSILDDQRLALFIRDYVDDKDAYDGMPFTRFYADCIGSGTPINWEDML